MYQLMGEVEVAIRSATEARIGLLGSGEKA